MRLDAFIIGLIVTSFMIVSGSLIWGDMINNYEVNATTDDFGEVYDIINDTYDLGQDMKEHTLEGDLESGDESWESMAKGSYSAVRMTRNTFTLTGNILNAVADRIGVHPFVVKFILSMIVVAIVFAVIYLVFRVSR